jgi:hypothetical protein
MGQSRISLVDISAGELEYIRIVHLVSCALEENFAVLRMTVPMTILSYMMPSLEWFVCWNWERVMLRLATNDSESVSAR